ncbi:response regulator [Paenibacillus contaminans]|uniref:DNA-binding response regulator n=1 Tax=Paenibacillus contaminans TaxID=450362 RepID=A0A329MST1_9BACL|nr:response regulator [Paenibacillus contaminans]RAV23039.1 hypothetical protein DQG23_02225 [Paenibacillus contaminans]
MYKVMVVDDEEIIVNGVCDYLNTHNTLDLDIYKSDNAFDAVSLMRKYRMDVVLTDIRMPGMTGIELQEQVLKYWPRSKVIFLTGYNEFTYIHTALRNGAVDYILKTEGYEKILEVVQRTIQEIEHEVRSKQYLEKAKEHMKHSIWQDYVLDLLHKEDISEELVNMRLTAIDFPLCVERPFMLIIGQIDRWLPKYNFSDRSLLLYAIRNIAEEYLSHTASCISVAYEHSKLAWMIQPSDPNCNVEYIHETFESIQRICSEILEMKISFIMSSEYCEWHQAYSKFAKLNELSSYRLGSGEECLLTEKSVPQQDENKSDWDRAVQMKMTENKEEQIDRTDKLISRIQQYINDNINQNLTLISLSEVVYLNPSYLSRLYKQVTGMNISDFITSVKVERAKEMLRNPKYRIQEISTALGFESPSYFTQLFKKNTGKTPLEFRVSLDQ